MQVSTNLVIWLWAVPLIISLLAFLVRGVRSRGLLEILHLIGIIVLLILSLWVAKLVLINDTLIAAGDWFYIDKLASIFVIVIGIMGFLNGLYSIGYMRHDMATGEVDLNKLSIYYGFFHLFIFTMLLAVVSNNIALMWAAVEATTLGSTFLVGLYYHKTSLEAAWKYVLICSVGVAFALYGTVLIYSNAFNVLQNAHGSMFWTMIVQNAKALDPFIARLAFVFIVIGFGTKAGLFPMHAWLPDAHSEAPSPVSAMLSGVLLKCALFAIIRYYVIVGLATGPAFPQILLLVFGLLSVGFAAFFVFSQRDIKRLLAYSSVENVGIIATGLGVGGALGAFAALFHTINHSIAKSLMFCCSGNILIKYGTRDLDVIKGMLKVAPVSGFLLGCGALAVAGSPPFNVFVSEFLTVSAGLQRGYIWLMILFLLFLLVVFAAFLRMIGEALFGSPPENVTRGDVNWYTLLPIALLFILMFGLGVYIPSPLSQLLKGAAAIVTGGMG
jgi:hydrogenase-4 component F